MSRPLAVLRPEPDATIARIEALGLTALRLPLFELLAVAWTPPDPAGFDALLLTSANAPRLAGVGLPRLGALPVYAVGSTTAEAARAAGLRVVRIGDSDGAALLAQMRAAGVERALHLAGRERMAWGAPVAEAITVYVGEARPIAPSQLGRLAGTVALLHSPRAAARLAALIADRREIRLAAISPAAAQAAGEGWAAVTIAERPSDAALIAAAQRLAD